MVAAATVLSGALLALGVAAGPAAGHAEVVSSTPRNGQSVVALPESVEITFTEVVGRPASVSVTGPGGADIATGQPDFVDDVLTQRVDATNAEDGRYSLNFQVVSADGHLISGTVGFDVGKSGGQASMGNVAAAEQTAGDRAGTGVVAGLVAGLVLALGLAASILARMVGRVQSD